MDDNNHGTRSRMGPRDQQMKKKLSEMGLFEEGMDSEEMMNLLKALDSSKHDISHPGNISPPSIKAAEVQHQMSLEYEEPTPSTNQHIRESSSPIQQVKRNNFNSQVANDSDEEIFDATPQNKQDNNENNSQKNHQLPTKSYSNILQNKNTGNRTTRMLLKVDNTENDLWRIQPFHEELINYVPLKSVRLSNRLFEPTRVKIVAKKIIIPHDKIADIKKKLEDVVNIWQKWELETTEQPEFRWGTPCQVESEKVDTQKYPRFEYKPMPAPDNEGAAAPRAEDYHDLPSTRQRSQALKKYDFESDDDSEFKPKAQKRSKNLGPRSQPPIKRRGLGPRSVSSRQKKSDFINDDSFEIDDNDEEWINTKTPNDTPKRLSIGTAFDISQIPDTEYVSRRITPPNPSRPKSTRGRKPGGAAKSNQNQLSILKVNNRVRETINKNDEIDITESPVRQSGKKLTDKQITEELMEENITDDEDDNVVCTEKKDERNDPELEKARSCLFPENRLAVSITRLTKKQEIERSVEKDAKVAEELNRQLESEEKEKRIAAKLSKADASLRAQEEAEKLKKEKEERYRKIHAKPRAGLHERNELKSDGDTMRPVDKCPWDPRADAQPLSINRNVRKTADLQPKVNCPICKKLFPPTEVEHHASTCHEFIQSDESDIQEIAPTALTPPTTSKQCGSDSSEAITILDSPVRNEEPDSEADNSDTYRGNFKPKQPSGRGAVNAVGRKRKR